MLLIFVPQEILLDRLKIHYFKVAKKFQNFSNKFIHKKKACKHLTLFILLTALFHQRKKENDQQSLDSYLPLFIHPNYKFYHTSLPEQKMLNEKGIIIIKIREQHKILAAESDMARQKEIYNFRISREKIKERRSRSRRTFLSWILMNKKL